MEPCLSEADERRKRSSSCLEEDEPLSVETVSSEASAESVEKGPLSFDGASCGLFGVDGNVLEREREASEAAPLCLCL